MIHSLSSRTILTVPIEGKIVIPDGSSAVNYHIALNGDQYSTICRVDGTFTFHEIPSGVYLLDVLSINEIFPQMKLKVSAENGSVTVVEFKYHGAKRVPAVYPMVITAIAQVQHFQKRPPFNLVGMIMANPMMLIMLFTGLIVIGMPQLLANMTPEELEEIKKQSAAQGDPMKQLSALMGGGAAKATNDDDDD